MTDAERKRRQRERQRDGQALYTVAVDEVDVTEWLVSLGLLESFETDCSSKVARALGSYINEAASRVTSTQAT